MSAQRIEIDTWCGGYANLPQHCLRERLAILGQVTNVRIQIECAIRWQDIRQTCGRKFVQQE
jgi:hypothetical protein